MPHPFVWVPGEGRRHASRDVVPGGGDFPAGVEVTTLCGLRLRAENSTYAWLWATCPACDTRAHALAETERHTGADLAGANLAGPIVVDCQGDRG